MRNNHHRVPKLQEQAGDLDPRRQVDVQQVQLHRRALQTTWRLLEVEGRFSHDVDESKQRADPTISPRATP